jgi:hypothetical protein
MTAPTISATPKIALDQRAEAYVKSQADEGWKLIRTRYDDGGYSGGSMDRRALKRLLDDVRAHRANAKASNARQSAIAACSISCRPHNLVHP